MDLTLKRHSFSDQGVFGVLSSDDQGNRIAVTLEHSYQDSQSNWVPKVQAGVYTCERHPPNRLPYETFMLRDVPDFMGTPVSGILIHVGNFDKDSAGCILIGKSEIDSNGTVMITASKASFQALMDLQAGLETFKLTILDC